MSTNDNAQYAIVLTESAAEIDLSPAALARRDELLASSQLITKVETAEQQRIAVATQTEIHEFTNLVEKSRRVLKEPFMRICKRIDAKAKEAIDPLNEEKIRLARLVGDYQMELDNRRRELERQRIAEIERLKAEAEKAQKEIQEQLEKKLAEAKTEEEKKLALAQAELEKAKVQDETQFNAQLVPDVPPPPLKEKNQIVRAKWVFRVVQDFELLRAHPEWVRKIEWDALRITDYLNAHTAELEEGRLKIPGLEVSRETVSTVRGGKRAIDI